jgi:hypothetical protein
MASRRYPPIRIWRSPHYAVEPVARVTAPVPLALTLNIEHDLGSAGQPGNWSACPASLVDRLVPARRGLVPVLSRRRRVSGTRGYPGTMPVSPGVYNLASETSPGTG